MLTAAPPQDAARFGRRIAYPRGAEKPLGKNESRGQGNSTSNRMTQTALELQLVERPAGLDMADERERVAHGPRDFGGADALSDTESATSHLSVDELVPDQRKAIVGRMVVVRYFSDANLAPKLFDAIPLAPHMRSEPLSTPPAEQFELSQIPPKHFDVLLKLDVTRGCGGRIWPAAERLGAYLTSRESQLEWEGKSVLELGTGTGLLGLVAARLGRKADIWVTDMAYVRTLSLPIEAGCIE